MPPEDNEPPPLSGWWSQLKVTELSGLISGGAFVCGLAYNAAYFAVLEPRLFGILDVWDHIRTAITFLPFIILFHAFNATSEWRFGPTPSWRSPFKSRRWLGTEKTRFSVLAPLVLVLLVCPPVLQIWGVILAMIWWGWDGYRIVVRHVHTQLPRWVLQGVLWMPVVVLGSAQFGFLDARSVESRKKPTTIQIKGSTPDNQSILLRVLDGGVLMFKRSSNEVLYYRWEQIERLETRRRRQAGW
jgi:hypothetical protein